MKPRDEEPRGILEIIKRSRLATATDGGEEKINLTLGAESFSTAAELKTRVKLLLAGAKDSIMTTDPASKVFEFAGADAALLSELVKHHSQFDVKVGTSGVSRHVFDGSFDPPKLVVVRNDGRRAAWSVKKVADKLIKASAAAVSGAEDPEKTGAKRVVAASEATSGELSSGPGVKRQKLDNPLAPDAAKSQKAEGLSSYRSYRTTRTDIASYVLASGFDASDKLSRCRSSSAATAMAPPATQRRQRLLLRINNCPFAGALAIKAALESLSGVSVKTIERTGPANVHALVQVMPKFGSRKAGGKNPTRLQDSTREASTTERGSEELSKPSATCPPARSKRRVRAPKKSDSGMQSFFDDSLLGGQPGAERDVCEEPGSAEESARAPGGMQENKDRHLGGICEEACIANPPEHDQQILDGDVVMRESRNDGEPEAELVHREGPSSVAGQEGHGSGQLTSEMEVETHESVNKVGACMGTEDTEEQKIGDEEARDERSRVGAGPLEKRGEEEQAKDAPRETGGVGDRIAANGADALEKNAGTSDTTETLTGGNDKDKLPLGKTANEAGATSPAGETEFCYRSWLEEVAEAASRRLTIAGDVYAVDIVEDTPRLRPPTGHTSAHEVTALPNGLHMIPDFLSVAEERQLLEFFGTGSQWDTEDLKRRTAQYGYVFDYNTGHTLSAIPPSDRKARFPPLFWDGVLSKLKTAPGVPEDLRHLRDPDQCIVNQYVPGQGIGAHVDRVNLFDHSIVVVSLGSDAVMDFTKRTEHLRRVAIPRRSCYIMTGESRYDWQHALKPCSSDTYKGTHFERTVRISLTFRKVTETAKARCTGGILLQNMAYASEAELRGKLLATAAAAGEPEPAAQAFLTELLGHHPLEPLVRLGGLANIASRGPRRGGEGRSDGGRRRDSVQDSMREEVLAAHAQLNGGQTSRGAGPESVGTIDGRTEEVARGFLDSQDAATPGESCCETITNGRSEGTPTPRSKHVTATDVATDTQSDDPSGGAATPRADGLAAQEPASLFERDQPTIRSHATPVSSRRTSFSSNFSTTPRAHREPRRWQSQYDPDSETPVFTHEKQVGSTVVCTVSGSCASGGPFIWDGAEVVSALFEKGDHDEARRMPTPTAQGLPCAVLAGREFTERALQRHLEDMPNGTPSTADHFLLSALLLRHPAASFLTTAGVDEFSKTDGEFYVHSSRAEKPRRWQPNTSARLLFSRGGATAVGGKPYVNERALKKKEKKTRQHVQSPAPSPVSAPADVPEEPKTATANDAERVVEGETADATDEFVIRFGSEY